MQSHFLNEAFLYHDCMTNILAFGRYKNKNHIRSQIQKSLEAWSYK